MPWLNVGAPLIAVETRLWVGVCVGGELLRIAGSGAQLFFNENAAFILCSSDENQG